MSIRILEGDCLAMLATLPDESVHCCVTSPPYYGLRDYGVAGQLGLEPTLAEYIEKMVAVFREVRRVLRSDGTLWLNIGDSYAGSWGAQGRQGDTGQMANRSVAAARVKSEISAAQIAAHPKRESNTGTIRDEGLKPKDLMMVPERLALALQADGWWVRSRIIWHKRSTMPESVTDRPTKAHEHIWLLTKSERYHYDSEAASEPVSDSTVARVTQEGIGEQAGSDLVPGKTNVPMKAVVKRSGNKERKDQTSHNGASIQSNLAALSNHHQEYATRNWRDVWSLGPEPFKDAHFATFPTEIPRRAIVAGCPVGGTVLDPFLGSGTTALVADRLQRNAIGIELNPAYADMAEKRIRGDAPLLVEVA